MSKPLICLIGKSGSGKNYIASKLERKGFASVKSYTTRPVRQDDPNDINTHTFISPDRVNEYKDDIVADTYFNGAYYFATRQQLNEADVYILDKTGLIQLYRNYHDRPIISIYLDVDSSICAERMSKRGDSDEEIFKRLQHDAEAFKDVKEYVDFVCDNSTQNLCNENCEFIDMLFRKYRG